MPSWWDAITPWDTDNEKQKKEAEAKAKAEVAKALASQRAQERASQETVTRKSLVDDWAKTAKPVIGPQPKPAIKPAAKPDPALDPAQAWRDPVQSWRDSAAQVKPPPTPGTPLAVEQPNLEVGLAFERPDTGVAPLQASQPINQTQVLGAPEQGPQRQPPQAWDTFSKAFNEWGARPIGAVAQATGVDDALNQVAEFGSNTAPDWYTNQPAYLKAQADDEWRRSEGSNTGYDAFLDNAGQFLDQAFTVPAKSLLNAPIPGSGGALGLSGDVGFSDVAGAFGGMLNQSGLNPFNPNKKPLADMQKAMWAQTSGEQGFYEASGMKDTLELAASNRALIDAQPPELKNAASMALTSTISGAENVRKTIDAILGQSGRVQELYQLAEQAQQQGDALGAAEYSRQAEELKNKSARDFVDENTNIWAEIVEGVLFDPTNLVGPIAQATGLSQEAMTATKNLQLFNMSPEAAQQAIESAMPDVQRIADNINLGQVAGDWWQRVNPFALTPDSKAHTTSNNIFRTASVIFNGVTDKEEALALAQNLVTNPAVLVAEGAAGPGLLANPDFLRDLPILHVAQEQIQNMRSLAGQGAFNPVEFLSELDNIVYQAARRANGLDDTMALPTGVTQLKLRRTAGGTGIIDYLGKDGKVIESSAEMVYYNAQQELKALNNAMGNGSRVVSALRMHDQIQRAVMSDLWLNMRPAHWVRNALSATTTLLADNLYTLRPTADIMEGMTARFGGALPTQRLAEAVGGVQEMTGSQSIFRKLGPLGAPLAFLAEKGGQIWSGGTALGPGGRVAFGEQNFYMRAFNQPFERFMNDQWPKLVQAELLPTLQSLGIDPAMGRRLQEIAVDAGVVGNKADVVSSLRRAVGREAISPNLRELGIAPDAFDLNAWKRINQLIQDGVPEDAVAIGQELRTIVQAQVDNLTRLVNASPPQPVRYAWTEAEQIEDGAEIIDSLTNAAKRAGVPVEQARQEASTFVQQIVNAERQALETFRTELTTNNNPSALNVAVDLWGQMDELKRVARAKVDQLGAAASNANTAEAWQNKWSETQKIYTDLSQFMQRTIDQARTDVLAIESGKEVPRRYDFWNMVDRYLGFDELATREARLTGMDLKAPSADPAWRQVVEANRAYVDASTAEAFQAFRRYASTDALDLIASAQKNIDRLGAQANGYLTEMREQLAAGMISKDRFYGIRNTVWGQMFDNAVLVNKAATWEIVQNGLAAQTDTMLRWSDEFAGGEFKLIAPGQDGLWTAKRLDDGTIHRFADPTRGAPGDVSSMPRVPQAVVNDYYRIAGQADQVVEAEIADIVQEVAQTIPVPQTLDELMQMIRAGTAPADELIPSALIDELMGGAAPSVRRLVPESSIPDLAGEAAAGATEARSAIYTPDEIAEYKSLPLSTVKGMFATELNELGYSAAQLEKMSVDDIVDSMASQTYRSPEWVTEQKKAIENANRDIAKLAQQYSVTPEEIERKLYDFLQQAVDASPVAHQIDSRYIDQVLESGRLKNQIVTGTSPGAVDSRGRKLMELRKLNIPTDTPGDARPIYGYLYMNRGEQEHMDAYGDLTLILNDSVKKRSRMTVGDFEAISAVPANAPAKEAIGSHAEQLYEMALGRGGFDEAYMPYIEMAMDGVALTDVRQVLDPTSTLTTKQIKRFTDLGIQVLQGEEAKIATVGQAAGPAMRELDYAVPAIDFDAILKRLQQRVSNPYELIAQVGDGFNPWGLLSNAKQDARQVFRLINEGVVNTRQVTPEVGDVAHYMANNAQQAYQRIMQQLPELLAGTPNQLTSAQQLRVIDAINALAAKHDDILAAAVKTGQDVADFAMLNYNQRRNFDTALQLAIPYHYFWSRSAGNWARRVAQKPAIANFYYEAQRGIDAQNERDNVPEHLQSTINIPGYGRVTNPLPYMIPFMSYRPSSFVDPNEAKSEVGRWINTVVQWGPGLLPSLDLARKYFVEGDVSDVSLGDYIPQYKLGGYGYQAATGNIAQGPWSYTDEFEYGRAGKQAALASARGDITPGAAQWAQDVGLQQQTGIDALPQQPAGAAGDWTQAARDSGWQRLLTTGAGYLTGLGYYPYSEEEQQLRGQNAQRAQLGYGATTNPYGSKEAQFAYDDSIGGTLYPYWNYRQMYPGDQTAELGDNKDKLRPGLSVRRGEYYDKSDVIYKEQAQGTMEYLLDNPEATTKEVFEFKKQYDARLDALKKEYEDVATLSGSGSTKGMSPDERAQKELERVLKFQPPNKPENPGEGAPPKELAKYYAEKAKWEQARLNYIEATLNATLNLKDELSKYPEMEDPGLVFAFQDKLAKAVGGEYASELLREHYLRNVTETEKNWSDRQSFVEEVRDAEFALTDKQIVDRFGAPGLALYKEYLQSGEAGSEERKAFQATNPEVKQIVLGAYNPTEYDAFVKRYGEAALDVVYSPDYPTHPGDSATDAQLEAYYTKLNAFSAKHPEIEELRLWLWGRGGRGDDDDYGKGYQEAVSIFGPNIFKILESFPDGGTKQQIGAWYDAHPQDGVLLTGYREWKKEGQRDYTDFQETEESLPSNAGAGTGYIGPRPVGSESLPIGQNPTADNSWLRTTWETPQPQYRYDPLSSANVGSTATAKQQPVNAWTQRANELNSAMFGGQQIPSEMGGTFQLNDKGERLISGDLIPMSGNGKTARDYAMQNEGFQKAEAGSAKWQQSQAEFAANRANVTGYFGEGGAAMWDEYYALPKGDARAEFMRANPVMRAINLYAYNKAELQPGLDLLGDEAFGLWAQAPAYADTPEAKAARAAYWDENPKAFLFHSWLNGRGTEGAQGEGFTYNFGADYNAAIAQFGENIWDIVGGYQRGWDKNTKRAYFDKNPILSDFFDWWHGTGSDGTVSAAGARTGAGASSGGGGGRSYGGGGGYTDYSEQEREQAIKIQMPYSQGLASGLAVNSAKGGGAGWRPSMADLRWLEAGRNLAPGKPKERKVDWIRKTGGIY